MPKPFSGNTPPLEVLHEVWGYDHFRPFQKEIIRAVLSGRDTLALLPTGGGKSLTYQIPALLLQGVTLVVSPLVALMKDQVEDLSRVRVRAAAIYSGLTRSQVINRLDAVLYSGYKLLYVSPERLKNETFLTHLSALDVSLLVVDEAHCISQWGYDFRPEYLDIALVKKHLPKGTPTLALTATATPEVTKDIRRVLEFREGSAFVSGSFYRSNLVYTVRRTQDKPRMIYHILESVPGSALIYVRTRKESHDLCHLLESFGLSVTYFHAGLSEGVKTERQNAWQKGIVRVMVCTNAFGMGINKKDVRLVIHPSAPSSLESYYQEAGRAGRDGQRSFAVLLYAPGDDERRLHRLLTLRYPDKELIREIYSDVCDFYQVAEGTGEGTVHEADLFRIQEAFGHRAVILKGALIVLEHAGYISYREEVYRPSYLRMAVGRNELYDLFSEREKRYDDLIVTLLRNYTGLFTDYAVIEETKLAALLGTDRATIYFMLLELRKWRVIEYFPGKRADLITFLRDRVTSSSVFIPRSAYEEMQERDERRTEEMIGYMSQSVECRSKLLQAYFGEKELYPCGYCDVCLREKPKGITYRLIDEVEALVVSEGRVTVDDLLARFPALRRRDLAEMAAFYEKERHPVRYLTDEGVLLFSPDVTD